MAEKRSHATAFPRIPTVEEANHRFMVVMMRLDGKQSSDLQNFVREQNIELKNFLNDQKEVRDAQREHHYELLMQAQRTREDAAHALVRASCSGKNTTDTADQDT